MVKKKVSVVVTNWNGANLLKKSLPIILKNSPEASEILVADDASSDNSLQIVKEFQKSDSRIILISHKKNLGFANNSNHAISKTKNNLVVLLNNDIYPEPDYIKNSLIYFNDKKLFGVSFCEINNPNWAKIFFKNGYFQYSEGQSIKEIHITGWVSGGSSIINKSIFHKLGGFDNIYEPFYSEDLDIGYRAWKSGYHLLWNPTSKVSHKHETTTSKFPRRFLDYVKERNRLLTVYRNITDVQYLRHNTIAKFTRILFGPNYLKIILAAQRQLNSYPKPVVFPKLTDKEIFAKFDHD